MPIVVGATRLQWQNDARLCVNDHGRHGHSRCTVAVDGIDFADGDWVFLVLMLPIMMSIWIMPSAMLMLMLMLVLVPAVVVVVVVVVVVEVI